MPRPDERWRHDRLGSLLRRGLSDARNAAPRPQVWDRVAAAIEPPARDGPVRRVLHRLSPTTHGGGHGALGKPWLLLPGSAALAVFLMVAVMREVPASQLGALREYQGTTARLSAQHSPMPLILEDAMGAAAAHARPALVEQQPSAAGDVSIQVEAPRRWTRFEPDRYLGDDVGDGAAIWLAAPEVAIVY